MLIPVQKTSSAYKYEQQEYYIPQQEAPQNQKSRKQKVSAKRSKRKMKTILNVLICFGIAFCILLRYAAITEASNQVDKLKRELTKLERVNEQTKIDLDRSIDLKKVEEIAKNNLGMKRPEKNQIVYVELKKNDYAEVVNKSSNKNIADRNFADLFSKVNRLLEYLH